MVSVEVMDFYDDEYAGQGGTYEVIKGKRRLVLGSRTLPPDAPADEPMAPVALDPVVSTED